jgi:hypothetical protein
MVHNPSQNGKVDDDVKDGGDQAREHLQEKLITNRNK